MNNILSHSTKQITDIFIHRPVLATVVSLLILVLGLRSMFQLPVRQFPFTQNAVITITTVYTGADPDVIAGFITTPLENSIAQSNGIDYLTSKSTQSISTIEAHLKLNYDPNKALNEITTYVNAVLNVLPRNAQQPTITISIGADIDAMYMGFYSDVLPSNKITDYLIRVVQPKLQTVEGVQLAEILGKRQFAMRAWLDPNKMAGFGITSTDVSNALAQNDFISAIGRTDGRMVTVNLTADTGLHTVEEFEKLIIKTKNGAIVRLADVATVSLGSEDYNTVVSFDAKDAVYIGIKIAPAANLLTTIEKIRLVFPDIAKQLPQGLNGRIVYDSTKYVDSSIHEVERSLIEAILIVTGVIFLFLGSLRSVAIPIVAIPLSLIGTFSIMLAFGYSINLLTLLALVLAIGLVVDDAIIVVENVHRHIENGLSPIEAALLGARELAMPIIAISIVLIAVYVPIGFMEGLTGALFTEFAFTLAGSVGISAIVALTLSPMMCSVFLKKDNNHIEQAHPPKAKPLKRLEHYIDTQFIKLENAYERTLKRSLDFIPLTAVFAIIILSSLYFLYGAAKHELAPEEDQGFLISFLTTAPNANIEQTQLYSRQVVDEFFKYPETDHTFQLVGVSGLNTAITGMVLKPWDERKRTANQLQPILQQKLSQIAGGNTVVFQEPPLPGSTGLPVQFVIGTTDPFQSLDEVTQIFMEKAQASGLFAFLDKDLKIDKLQATVKINRDMTGLLGLTMQDVGNLLGSALGGNYINYFSLDGRSYKVIPQMIRSQRISQDQLLNYYFKTPDGVSIPLSTIVQIKTEVVPESLNHFQQLNSTIISGVTVPGVTLGQALEGLKTIAKDVVPQGYSIDYANQSRQFIQESSALILTFFFALIIIYLTLAALFESFRDPLIVMISVPMSIFGAMIFIVIGIGGASLNIYTEVGLVTLIGLISKHGILIVQFANDCQKEGLSKYDAIQKAAGIRLRPILMTTASMVLGVMPLLTASGAGAVSRFNIGLVIASGISIGTLFTLYVVPALYLVLSKSHDTKSIERTV
jgi:multidrug efflux pump